MASTEVFNELLRHSEQGNAEKTAILFPIVYNELKKIAHNQMRNAWALETMQTTALINETYLKLLGQQQGDCKDRHHFFALCAKAMRQILINYAEQKNAKKRGGMAQPVTLIENMQPSGSGQSFSIESLLAVDEALIQLAEIDPHLCQIVELRFFAGLSESEIAHMLNKSERTVRRDWSKAKALLAHLLAAE